MTGVVIRMAAGTNQHNVKVAFAILVQTASAGFVV